MKKMIVVVSLWLLGSLPGIGQIVWELTSDVPTACDALKFTTGDFNNDGNRDVVALSFVVSTATVCLEFFAGDGQGNLAPPVLTELEDDFDFLRNGSMFVEQIPTRAADLLFVNSGDQLYTYALSGNGTFTRNTIIEGPEGASYPDLWEVIDSPNLPFRQIAVFSRRPEETINLFSFSSEDGGLIFTSTLPLAGPGNVVDIATSDITGEGSQDIVLMRPDLVQIVPAEAGILIGNFDVPVEHSEGIANLSMTGGDYNGDGLGDLAFTSLSGSILLFLNQNGSFAATAIPDLAAVSVEQTRDMDQDGDQDILYNIHGIAYVLWNKDSGFESSSSLSPFETPSDFADMNNDGHLDIVSVERNGSALLGLADGNSGPITLPGFLNANHFWRKTSTTVDGVFPDPGSDGRLGELGYQYWFEANCNEVTSRFELKNVPWPYAISHTDIPPNATLKVARIAYANSVEINRSETWTLPIRQLEDPQQAATRWHLHVPNTQGSFGAQIRMTNRHPEQAANLRLGAYGVGGDLLGEITVVLDPEDTRYALVANGVALFSEITESISHLSVQDDVGGQTETSLQIKGNASSFGTWVPEVDLKQGTATSSSWIMEGRTHPNYVDGLALLNLTGTQPISVWAVQLDQRGLRITDAFLGEIPPGGKLLSVVSSLFAFEEGSRYRIETRSNDMVCQILGMTFFEGTFFGTVPARLPD